MACTCCPFSLGFTLPSEQGWISTYAQVGPFSGRIVGLYRTFLLGLSIFVLIHALDDYFAEPEDFGYFFIYLTHWGAMLEFVYFSMLFFTTWRAVSVAASDDKKSEESTPVHAAITWIVGTILPSVTLLIVILYWTLVYEGGTISLSSVVLHGVNYIPVLMDLLTTRQPFYLRHVYVPLLLAATYSFFTFVYHSADGTNENGKPYIYSAIDWKDTPGSAAVTLAMAVFVGVPIVHAFHSLLLAIVGCVSSACGCEPADDKALKVDPAAGKV
mmetsp:Transcript_13192/g.30042  ORF Transcript_13192/g.30042 Transcript_13192/m.30042 type:complete len:271 (-) Transcript_13192:160-972(-)